MVDEKLTGKYLTGFVTKVSNGHPYHLHIGRTPGIETRYQYRCNVCFKSIDCRPIFDVIIA